MIRITFSTGTLDSLRKGRSLNLSTIETICKMLNVFSITEIVEYIPEDLTK
ncbi:helix-turn-helix domain-containing protein [Blautia sp. 2744]|uniref:Helix-turn-helix domain-containing protein n=1 Tax=Blautia intestinalis TaxID=2763028 RepID=A0ABR7I294_9FIRM|nr:helix-turn-helix domain-containing protein [Blautia intestinalis]